MKFIFVFAAFCLFVNSSFGQIQNSKTETITVFGNCGMCKKNIETSGFIENMALVKWDKETKIATITYDAKNVKKEDILKKIAMKGYDNEAYLAPNEVYEALHTCCHYERTTSKTKAKQLK
jgi:hypothetical protein